MKKLLAQIVLAFPMWLMLGSVSFAMCIWFAPPSRQFSPATNMKTLVSFDGANISMTVQPQFSGNATDFALVMPFPSEPTVNEAPETIFTELEDLTNPLIDFDGIATADALFAEEDATRSGGVQIIEERDVGDFSTVTLSATNESALITWLNNEGYEIPDTKAATIADYVNSDGYFVALKVNIDEAKTDSNGTLEGELKPITFNFESDSPMLPLRLMSGENSLITLTVYTLNDAITYVPGAEIQFSKKVDATHLKEAPALEEYDAWKKWLVRNVMQVDTEDISADVNLLTTSETRVVVPGEIPIVLNPDQLPKKTGIIVSENGETIYTEEASGARVDLTASNDGSVSTPAIIILVITNVILLGIIIVQHNALHGKKLPTRKK